VRPPLKNSLPVATSNRPGIGKGPAPENIESPGPGSKLCRALPRARATTPGRAGVKPTMERVRTRGQGGASTGDVSEESAEERVWSGRRDGDGIKRVSTKRSSTSLDISFLTLQQVTKICVGA